MSTNGQPKGKAAKLAAKVGKTADESMGATRKGESKPSVNLKVPEHLEGVENLRNAKSILVSRIEPDPAQPRAEFDDEHIENLKRSMLSIGQQQAITVYWHKPSGKYRLVAGENRWRAAKLGGIKRLDARVIEAGDDGAVLAAQLSENGLRKNLSPLEEARAFQRLISEFGWTQVRISEEIGYSKSHVTRTMAVLKLPDEIQDLVGSGEGRIAPTSAYELTKVLDPDIQRELAGSVAEGVMPHDELVHQVREANSRHSDPEPVPALPPVPKGPQPIPATRNGVATRNVPTSEDREMKRVIEEQEAREKLPKGVAPEDGWNGPVPPTLAKKESEPDPIEDVQISHREEPDGLKMWECEVDEGAYVLIGYRAEVCDPRPALKLATEALNRYLKLLAKERFRPGMRVRVSDPDSDHFGKEGTVDKYHHEPHGDCSQVSIKLDCGFHQFVYFEGLEAIGGEA